MTNSSDGCLLSREKIENMVETVRERAVLNKPKWKLGGFLKANGWHSDTAACRVLKKLMGF